MINWNDINELQKERIKLQEKLNILINSENKSVDEINSIKAEILYLDKRISSVLGNNEIKRMQELKNKTSDLDAKNKRAYYALKDKYKKINKMKIATDRMILIIENLNNEFVEEKVKVK